jgi:hypothetical protein
MMSGESGIVVSNGSATRERGGVAALACQLRSREPLIGPCISCSQVGAALAPLEERGELFLGCDQTGKYVVAPCASMSSSSVTHANQSLDACRLEQSAPAPVNLHANMHLGTRLCRYAAPCRKWVVYVVSQFTLINRGMCARTLYLLILLARDTKSVVMFLSICRCRHCVRVSYSGMSLTPNLDL